MHRNLEKNMGAVVLAADAVNVIASNSAASKAFAQVLGGCFVLALGKALYDVIDLRLLNA